MNVTPKHRPWSEWPQNRGEPTFKTTRIGGTIDRQGRLKTGKTISREASHQNMGR